jgi:2-oxoisovalerate dehydrogenase E1 component alpha subunit
MQGAAPAPHTTNSNGPLEDDVVRVLRDDGSLDPEHDPKLDSDSVIAIYGAMVRVRLLDERLVGLQRQGRIGFHIGSQGEEAAIVGSAAALRPHDWIFPCYREFGAALWRGMPLAAYVNHMFGNESDPMKGRQMPDHYGAKVARFTSISSPVGTQITHAAGFAWAAKIDRATRKRDGREPLDAADVATLVYFGEGATSSGEFHNGMNFAGVFNVPLVLLCRNNGWIQALPGERPSVTTSFADKGVAYGVPGIRCDGNDLFAVIAVVREAIARAARGDGPTLVEALTARMPPARDGAKDPNDPWKKRDPLVRVRRHLEARGVWSEAKQREHEAATLAEIDAAIELAERVAPPALGTIFDDVFQTPTHSLDEQREELLASPRATGLAKP